jgi:hypothetical protein
MSKYITETVNDLALKGAFNHFSSVCAADAAALGLSPAEVAEITEAAAQYESDILKVVAAKAKLSSAVCNKDEQKAASRDMISRYAKRFRANRDISDAILTKLQLAPHETPGTHTKPTPPLALVATSDGQGNIKLIWDRNGNRQTTIFQIEVRYSPSDPWKMLGVTTQTKFRLRATPGSFISFRVFAHRNSVVSAAGTPVTLWHEDRAVALKAA